MFMSKANKPVSGSRGTRPTPPLGDPRRLSEKFLRAGDRTPPFPPLGSWLQTASSYEEAGKLPQALQAVEEGLRQAAAGQAPAHQVKELSVKRADLLIRLGRGETAARLLRSLPPSSQVAELLERSGSHREAVLCYLDLDRIAEATRLAARAPNGERLQAEIHLRTGKPAEAGNLLAKLGLAREAAEAYEAAQEWGTAAYRWEAAGEHRRAAEAYEKAGRLRDAARCFEATEMPAEAAAVLARIGDIGKAAAVHLRRRRPVAAARAYLAAGDKVRAASILLQMQPGEPELAEGALLLAPLLIEEGFHQDALDRLRQLPKDAPPALALESVYWQGRCHESLGQLQAAWDCYQKVVESDPGHHDAWRRIEGLQAAKRPPTPRSTPAAEQCDAVPVDTLEVGSLLAGRYEILAEAGRGGMGRVYKARDRELGEVVAIKTLLVAADASAQEETRLLREVQICRRISHPNVVRIYDLGRFPGGCFITMEYLEGCGLDDVIAQESPLPFARVRFILAEIAAGLAEAHAQGIVHRDLKPGNVMVTAKRVKILDFGIAAMAGLGARLTRVGFVMGSPMYMSPDQIHGRELDGRSDLYSLGVLAYTLIAGREPFEAADFSMLLLQHMRAVPPDVRELRPETPAKWAALLSRLLAKDPDDRFQSAQEVLDALAQLPV
jgi:tetratricopeptide (TPR) repeat protein